MTKSCFEIQNKTNEKLNSIKSVFEEKSLHVSQLINFFLVKSILERTEPIKTFLISETQSCYETVAYKTGI